MIQRFEFCTELAWKTLREYLLDQGYTEINSPRATLKQAFAEGIITDEAWLTMLADRNMTSHVYDDATAAENFRPYPKQISFAVRCTDHRPAAVMGKPLQRCAGAKRLSLSIKWKAINQNFAFYRVICMVQNLVSALRSAV